MKIEIKRSGPSIEKHCSNLIKNIEKNIKTAQTETNIFLIEKATEKGLDLNKMSEQELQAFVKAHENDLIIMAGKTIARS